MCGFNEARRLWIITKSVAELTNGDFEDAIADKRFRPDGVEKFLFGDELGWMREEIRENGEGFGSELNRFRASDQVLVGQVQVKGVEDYAFFTIHVNYQTLPKDYGEIMTYAHARIIVPLMKGWQYKGAFVVQFRRESDMKAGRVEGRVEHMASYKATRFHSLDELLDFIANVLTEVKNAEPQ